MKAHQGVRVSELYVLLANVVLGAQNPNVGFEDANRTLEDIMAVLDKRAAIPTSALESALWSCNLLDEREEFYHPDGLTFDEFVDRMLERRYKFDKTYNCLEERERDVK